MAARPAVAHYRLSRQEYQNTVYDLLGVRYDPAKPGELNEDTLWHGYERIGSQLSLSPSHMDRYYRAAEIVLDRAFPATVAEARKVRKTAAELRYGGGEKQQEALDRLGIKRPYVTCSSPAGCNPPCPQLAGQYRPRTQRALQTSTTSQRHPPARWSAGAPEHWQTHQRRDRGRPARVDITAPEDKPQVYELEVFLEMPTQLHFAVVATDVIDRRGGAAFRNAIASRNAYIFTHSSETLLLNPNAPQMFDDKGNGIFSTVILDWVEWEGPLVTDAEKSRRPGVLPPEDASAEVVAEHLQRFAERAWRRAVQPEELKNYLGSYHAAIQDGEKPATAYRTALQGVLTSRHFIYLVEGDDPQPRERLTGQELASRLSYFLWSSMPDDALFTAAKDGALKGDNLKQTVNRMLLDDRINRFIDDFSRQWLQLHRVGMFPPDKDSTPVMMIGSRSACAMSRSSISANCSTRTSPSRACLIRTGRWPTPGSAISMVCPSRRPVVSSV